MCTALYICACEQAYAPCEAYHVSCLIYIAVYQIKHEKLCNCIPMNIL